MYCYILVDIDHFKEINDHYSHEVGDSVLKEFSLLLNKNVRNGDYFSRWGGEEFLILATNQNQYQAQKLAERLREKIENHPFSHVKKVTASFGNSELTDQDDISPFISRADKALYLSKKMDEIKSPYLLIQKLNDNS
ncbi:GGDEF domain-containing protein [Anaerobacillus sp. MEB173]|uniref:GGDEF domain-containing protein n=1 Tax=Anaerobacillus sp. MEB173 TaxID=3383345 RepID=UPI003F932D37